MPDSPHDSRPRWKLRSLCRLWFGCRADRGGSAVTVTLHKAAPTTVADDITWEDVAKAGADGEWVTNYPQTHDCYVPGRKVSKTREFGVNDRWRCLTCKQVWHYRWFDNISRPPFGCYEWHRELPIMDDTGRQLKSPENEFYHHIHDPEYKDPAWRWEPDPCAAYVSLLGFYSTGDPGKWVRVEPEPEHEEPPWRFDSKTGLIHLKQDHGEWSAIKPESGYWMEESPNHWIWIKNSDPGSV